MDIYYSELCVLGGNVFENVDKLIESGADHIEVMLDGQCWNEFHNRMDDLVIELKKRPVTYSVHSPVWDTNLTSENYHIRQAVMESLRQSIIFAAKLSATHVVIHPGFSQNVTFNKEIAKARSRDSIMELIEFNKDYGMLLLIENVGNAVHSIFTFEEYINFLNDFPEKVGYLIDIGHAHMNHWNIEKLLLSVKDRLYAIHIHDNDGVSDQHLPIGEGITDWDSIFNTVKQTECNPSLVLEYDIGIPVQKLAEGKHILEKYFNLNL
jgi:sugar phosphate isomerase/epimerase